MIDLHCHLLPNVDDGPETLLESIALAKMAVADGITVSVLTPHIHPTRYVNTRTSLQSAFEAFKQALKSEEIPLALRLGGEMRLSLESLDLILEEEVPFLGTVDGYRIVLLEFPHQIIPVGSAAFVSKLLSLKIRPLIAHPERNKIIMSNPEKVRPFVDMGCWLQVTAGSLVGGFGEAPRKAALHLLENEWVWVIASDGHNLAHRPAIMSDGRDAITKLVGADLAQCMVHDRPADIIGLSPELQ
jgi:protein-tyrosine phosphatase